MVPTRSLRHSQRDEMTPSPKMTGYIRDEMGGGGEEKTRGDRVCYFDIFDDMLSVRFGFLARNESAARGATAMPVRKQYTACCARNDAAARGARRKQYIAFARG